MSAPDKYEGLQVHVACDVFDDGDLIELAMEFGPAVWGAWLAILTKTKEQHDRGRVPMTAAYIAKQVQGVDLATARGILAGLIERRRLLPVEGIEEVFDVARWTYYQESTNTERQRIHRRKKRAERAVTERNEPVTGVSRTRNGGVTTQVTGNRKQGGGSTSSEVPMRDTSAIAEPATADLPVVAFEPDPPPSKPKAPPMGVSMDTVREVFEHWRQAFGKTRAAQLDDKRTRRIRWAVKTYGVELAKQAITGYSLDPWPDRSKHSDLTLIFRDAGKTEYGLRLFADHHHDAAKRDAVADRLTRLASLKEALT